MQEHQTIPTNATVSKDSDTISISVIMASRYSAFTDPQPLYGAPLHSAPFCRTAFHGSPLHGTRSQSPLSWRCLHRAPFHGTPSQSPLLWHCLHRAPFYDTPFTEPPFVEPPFMEVPFMAPHAKGSIPMIMMAPLCGGRHPSLNRQTPLKKFPPTNFVCWR